MIDFEFESVYRAPESATNPRALAVRIYARLQGRRFEFALLRKNDQPGTREFEVYDFPNARRPEQPRFCGYMPNPTSEKLLTMAAVAS